MRHAIAYAVMTAMLVLPLPSRAEDTKPATFDPLSIFAPAMLDRLQRDHRCDDVRPLAEAVVKSDGDDAKSDIAAMRAFEHCASLSRLGDWDAYVDYAVLGAATAAFLLGRAAHDPDAYDRAVQTAKLVHGFDPGFNGKAMVVVTRRVGPDPTNSKGGTTGDPDATASGPLTYKNTMKAVDATNLKSELGLMATQIAALSQAALEKK